MCVTESVETAAVVESDVLRLSPSPADIVSRQYVYGVLHIAG